MHITVVHAMGDKKEMFLLLQSFISRCYIQRESCRKQSLNCYKLFTFLLQQTIIAVSLHTSQSRLLHQSPQESHQKWCLQSTSQNCKNSSSSAWHTALSFQASTRNLLVVQKHFTPKGSSQGDQLLNAIELLPQSRVSSTFLQ